MTIDVNLSASVDGVSTLHLAAPRVSDGNRFRGSANPLASLTVILSELSGQSISFIQRIALQDATACLVALAAAAPGIFW